MQSQLEELAQFLEPTSRIELKSTAVTNLLTFSSNMEIVENLITNPKLLSALVDLTTDASYAVAKDACFGKTDCSIIDSSDVYKNSVFISFKF